MKIFLVLSFLISGTWVTGKDLPHGWWPVQYDTLDECLERAEFYNDRRVNPDTSIAQCVVVSEDNDRYG